MNENVNYDGFDHGDYSAYMLERKIAEDIACRPEGRMKLALTI